MAKTLSLVAASAVIGAMADCPIGALESVSKLKPLAEKLKDSTDLKLCGIKVAVGLLKPDDFCDDGVCAMVTKQVEEALGVTATGGNKWADCALLDAPGFKIGTSIDNIYKEKALFCKADTKPIEAMCFLSTASYELAEGLTFDKNKCSLGLRGYACEEKDGRCGARELKCPGNQSLDAIEGAVKKMLDECAKAAVPSDACKEATKEAVALLRVVGKKFKETTAKALADKDSEELKLQVKKAAALTRCLFDTIQKLNDELKAELFDKIKKPEDLWNKLSAVAGKIKAGKFLKPDANADADVANTNKAAFMFQLVTKLSGGGVEKLKEQMQDFTGLTDKDFTDAEVGATARLESAEAADEAALNGAPSALPSFLAMATLAVGAVAAI